MLALYGHLFAELEKHNVDYGVWKNRQELPDALSGNGDIDLYVHPGSKREFLAVLLSLRFIRSISHKSYPCIEHYYGYDAISDSFAHLHCYYRIVTGESHIKQYVVPIEHYLQDYPGIRNAQGIREIHPLLQKRLNVFRRKIKLSCLPGALLFYRERHGYRQERELSTLAMQNAANERDLAHLSGWLAEMNESPSTAGEILDGLRYRFLFRHWNRFHPMLTPVHRYRAIVIRLLGKLRKQKKTLPMGITLAITGADPAITGQIDTMICNWMKLHFSVRSLRDDDHETSLAELCAKLMPATTDDAASPEPSPSLAILTCLTWRAWQWRRQARRAAGWSVSGSIVIWNACETQNARRDLRAFAMTPQRRSRMTAALLQICDYCLKIEPEASIRLHIGSSIPEQPVNPVITSACRLEAGVPSPQLCQASAIPTIFSTWSPRPVPDQGLSDENCATELRRIKQEIWESVSSLQH